MKIKVSLLKEHIRLAVQEQEQQITSTITPDEAEQMINSLKRAEFFTVMFIKKDGTERVMNAQKGVTKHLAGGELKFDPNQRGLIVVFDSKSGGYRMINKNTLKWIKVKGKVYQVV